MPPKNNKLEKSDGAFMKVRYLLIALLVLLVYGNTLTLNYALDDRMIIFENDYTLQGIGGAKEVLTQDAFTGYFGNDKNLVTGGRYRPLSQLTFMAEYDIFGQSIHDKVQYNRAPQNEKIFSDSILPVVSHANNVLLFIVLCVVIYCVLQKIFAQYENRKWYLSLPFVATLIFALHPLHTEAVANIKGRDEILCMLGAMLTLYALIKYVSKHQVFWLFLAFFTMLIAIFSKENAITFLAVVPLALYFLPGTCKKSDYLVTLIPVLAAVIVFLAARYNALGGIMNQVPSQHILNNPFAKSTLGQEIATVLLTWAIYFKLMIIPYPLTHDYYPKQIAITDFGNPAIWLIIIAIAFIVYYAIRNLKRKNTIAFGILFFIITFSITSNLLFNVGTLINERFLFTSLLGFSIVVAFLIQKLSSRLSGKIIATIFISVFSLFSIDTFARNFVWKDDITLFTTDVKTSSNSIKCNISAGGSYLKLYEKEKKKKHLQMAEQYLNKAFELGDVSMEAYSLLGKVYFQKGEFERSKACYQTILNTNPQDKLAQDNLKVVELAMANNQVKAVHDKLDAGQVAEALQMGKQLLAASPDSPEVLNLMGKIYGKGLGQLDQSISYLQKAIEIAPNYVSALENLGIAYAMKNRFDLALQYLNQALVLEPENANIQNNIEQVRRNSKTQ